MSTTTDLSSLRELRLRKNEDRRLRAGHLWIFSNEVDIDQTPLTAFEPGEQVRVLSDRGKSLGIAYVNPASLIAARIVSRHGEHLLDASLISHRLNVALALREQRFSSPHYRLVFGESDRLPGLVLDRYGDVIVGQITTAGMDRHQQAITDAVVKKLSPGALIWRNDSGMRALEGLAQSVEVAFGTAPERLEIIEGEVSFTVDAAASQKTGWFYDQRANRDRYVHYVRDRSVLDLFSYAGGWGLRAAAAGARAVTCVDSAAQAIADIETNARANRLLDRTRIVRADAFQFLEQAIADGERYDVVVLDPPAFAKRRKDAKAAISAYRRLNELALRLLERDGILVTCSCSWHLRTEVFLDVVHQAGRHVDRHLQRLETLGQAPDHPVHPAIPETDYLKGAIYRSTVS